MASAQVKATLAKTVSLKNGPVGLVYGAMDRNGRLLACEAAGKRSLGQDQEMTTDTILAIYSCTKVVGAIAVMQLVEQGLLSLDGPIESILPEVVAAQIIDDAGNLTPPKTKITLRMLLTHTSGFSYPSMSPTLKKWADRTNAPPGTLQWYTQPLVREPNTEFVYGIGIDWAAEAVHRVTGLDLDEYCKKHVFGPLGVTDVTWKLSPEQRTRAASIHERNLTTGVFTLLPDQPTQKPPPSFLSAGGGLFATVPEYLKIILPLVNSDRGANGAQILRPQTVQEMLKDSVPHIAVGKFFANWPGEFGKVVGPGKTPGVGYGLSFMIAKDKFAYGRGPNSVWWSGLANLHWSADPENGIVDLIASQHIPFGDQSVADAWEECQKSVYAAQQ